MTDEQNYVDLCNWADAAVGQGKALLERLSDEEIKTLRALLLREFEAIKGEPWPLMTFMRDLVDDELKLRAEPKPERATPGNILFFDRVPF